MLTISELTYRIAGRPLLENASLSVPNGHRIGLVGRNGSGKTTLLRLIANELQPDEGAIRIHARAKIGIVSQEAPSGPDSLFETVLRADTERTALLAESEQTASTERLADIHDRLHAIDAYSAPARAATILAGLGFSEEQQHQPLDSFSGGWKMRVALAAVLFLQPDLLLLDEPTNHLDLEAAIWLEGYLKTYPGTIILISHDRELLNTIPTSIVHLEHRTLTFYQGGYDRFERTRRMRLELASATARKLDEKRKHMQAFVDRFRYKASKARQAQSRLKAMERLESVSLPIDEQSAAITFPEPDQIPPPLLSMNGVSVGYAPGKPVLRNLNLRIDSDDRIAFLGANGNGKSTLAKLITGRLGAESGDLKTSPKLNTGYFAQHQLEELEETRSPFAQLSSLMPDSAEPKIRARLGSFGFSQDRADVPAGDLSGGEKARLLLALASYKKPNLLVLDEPTNHLDMDSREALVEALNAYQGAVILISHDRHLIELCADRLWLVKNGTVLPYEQDMETYSADLLSINRDNEARKPVDDRKATKKDDRRARAENRQRTAHLRKAIQQASKDVEELGRKKAEIEGLLANPKLYDGPSDTLTQLMKQQADINAALAKAEDAWLEAEDALESASSTD